MSDKLLYKVYEVLVGIYNRLAAIIAAIEMRLDLVDATEPTIWVEFEKDKVDAA